MSRSLKRLPALAVAAALGVALVACGATARNGADAHQEPPEGVGGASAEPQPGAGEAAVVVDPGYLPVHRLTNDEYDNTLAEVLGTSTQRAQHFPGDGGYEFRNDSASQASISSGHAELYFTAASELVGEVFATPALKQRVLVCAAPSEGDAACAQTIIEDFGLRAWRRPLEAAEVEMLVGRYQDALVTLEKDHEGAVAHVLRIMLTSIKFMYLIEIDPDLQVAASQGRSLGGYELASRLSYALWGSPPDDTLRALAESEALLDEGTLKSQVNRLLDDAKAPHFVQAFLSQYLKVRDLANRNLEPAAFPSWNHELALAMSAEASAFLATFVARGRPWSELLTAPVSSDAVGLSEIYAQDPTAARQGLLTLPAVLTWSSAPSRTSPVRRGSFVMTQLLCESLIPPPDVDITIPPPGPPATNVREQLEQHRVTPGCAVCHVWIDPVGLAFENFDAIGRYRTTWDDGQLIDSSGVFVAGGKDIAEPAPQHPFSTMHQLLSLLSADERVARCASRKLLSYMLRRTLREEDEVLADRLGTVWNAGELRTLVEELVQSDVFRLRKLPEDAL